MCEPRILGGLEPERVFYYFEQISRIPRASGNRGAISAYIVSWAENLGLWVYTDDAHNVIVRKSAAPGCEAAPSVILQGHMDMVGEAAPGSSHNFDTDPLRLFVDGDLIGARDTTLGGDDGIAVAMMMALCEDKKLVAPELECIFTVDEEIGLLGANALDCGILRGKRMINLDSESEGILTVSCAGGMTMENRLPVSFCEASGRLCRIKISHLLGGHSGAEIHKIRANANILMGRLLFDLSSLMDYGLSELSGGNKDNAIPREAQTLILIADADLAALETFLEDFQRDLRNEYAGSDPDITVSFEEMGAGPQPILNASSLGKLLFYLNEVPDGVQKMSGQIPGLVETSLNLGICSLTPEYFRASSSLRSSVSSEMSALANKLCFLCEFLGGESDPKGQYPAWEYRTGSRLQDLCRKVYREQYGEDIRVEAIHAGLECALFYERIPDLDCVSIGPDMKAIHTCEERLSVSSCARLYRYLKEVLKQLADQ